MWSSPCLRGCYKSGGVKATQTATGATARAAHGARRLQLSQDQEDTHTHNNGLIISLITHTHRCCSQLIITNTQITPHTQNKLHTFWKKTALGWKYSKYSNRVVFIIVIFKKKSDSKCETNIYIYWSFLIYYEWFYSIGSSQLILWENEERPELISEARDQ